MEAQSKIHCIMQGYAGTLQPCSANLGLYICHNNQYSAFWFLPVKCTAVGTRPEDVVLPSWPVVFYFPHSFDTAPKLNDSEVVHVHAMRAEAGNKAELHSFLISVIWSVLRPLCFTP
jgi:hypothetical protein